jgi:signal transduction histidine kinase
VAQTSGLTNTHYATGHIAAPIAALLMTVPIVFARRRPAAVAATLAFGAALNWVAIGHMVRCGAGLPAVFYTGFVLGSRTERRETLFGLGFLVVSLTCQISSDPQLTGYANLILFVPITLAFAGAGRLLRRRNATVAGLRVRTRELREQREANARLAVEADRARIAGDLDQFLHEQISEIASTAAAGQVTLSEHPGETLEAFSAIRQRGRDTLSHMRNVVGGLRADATTEPQPVLAQLDRLLAEGTEADARLQVKGDPRLLPPGVELSGYRIVEHLLVALEDDPTARIDVVAEFRPDALELIVTGPNATTVDARSALAAATERATLLGGSLRSQARGGHRETVVLLPLAT